MKLTKERVRELRKQFPHLSENEIKYLRGRLQDRKRSDFETRKRQRECSKKTR